MNEKILKAIADTLPETQVKLIKESLIERDELKEEVEELKKSKKYYKDAYDNEINVSEKYSKEVYDLQLKVDRLEVENKELKQKEIKNEVEVLKSKLEGVEETTDKFLKNTIYRESLQHKIPIKQTNVTNEYVNGQYVPVPREFTNTIDATDIKEIEAS